MKIIYEWPNDASDKIYSNSFWLFYHIGHTYSVEYAQPSDKHCAVSTVKRWNHEVGWVTILDKLPIEYARVGTKASEHIQKMLELAIQVIDGE